MTLLSWYSVAGTPLWTWLGKIFTISFHWIVKFGWLPNVFYICCIAFLFCVWMYMMRKYEGQAKDKGLID